MKKFLKNYYVEILAFVVPVIIFLLAMAFNGLLPFGEKYIVAYDASAQYLGFTNNLMNVLKGNNSLLYSFKGGLGYNFYATAIYYLFNPTNLLSVFFDNTTVMYYYILIVLLRLGLSGLSMSFYLKYKNKESKGRLLFSIAYALIAYNVVYFYNFMYFDTVVLLPLVILGLDKIIDKKSPKTYIIFLTLSIISNYYIGSMTCIFSLLYFIYRFIIINKKDRKGLIKTFILSSLLSGIMCAFVLLPEFFELMRGKVQLYGEEYTKYNVWSFDFLSSFYRLSIASYINGDQINGSPNIYCSLLAAVYVILFFFNKNFTKKEKIATLVFIAFFLLCFSYNFLDYAWQFFQKPCWYPNRYSFVFSFLLINIAYKSYNNVDKDMNNKLIVVSAISLVLLIIGGFLIDKMYTKNDFSKYIFLVLSIICIAEYMFSYKFKLIPHLITLLFIFEITANTLLAVKQVPIVKKVSTYDESFYGIKETFDYIEKIDPIKNNFYRSDSQSWVNLNNGGLFNYNGLVYFNSLRNGALINFLKNYGYYTVVDNCSTRFNAVNPVLTSLFGMKYIVSSNVEQYYDKINDEAKYGIYKNNEALSLGIMMNSKIKDTNLIIGDTYENTNRIVSDSLDKEYSFIKKVTYTSIERYREDEENVYYDSTEGGYVSFVGYPDKDYLVLMNPYHNSSTVNYIYINDKADYMFNNFSPYLVKKGEKYEVRFVTNSSPTPKSKLFIYLLDVEEYKKWINELKENELEIIKYEKDNYIKGKVTVTEDKKTLFTSIPYDDGWTVLVDGKKVKYEKLLTTFIGVDLEVGEHIIEFKYVPKGLIPGLIVSFISLITTIGYLHKFKEKNKKVKNT